MKTVAEVVEFIEGDARASGHVRLLHRELPPGFPRSEAPSQANLLVQEWGYNAIASRSWARLNRKAASEVARRILGEDLAYKRELMPRKTSEHCAESLTNALSPYKAEFLCNAEFQGTSVTWDPIGTSTFEVALVGFDEDHAFFLYADAED